MGAMPRDDNRVFRGPITVTCPRCNAQREASTAKRNDHKWPGHHCDGPAPVALDDRTRHSLTLMVGPEGKAWA